MLIYDVIKTVALYTDITMLTVLLATSLIFFNRLSFSKVDTSAKITLGLQIISPIMRLYDDIASVDDFLKWFMLTLPTTFIWLSLYFFIFEMQSIYLVLSENDP